MNASQTSIEIVRLINAPPARVFAAWIDPRLISRWLAPGGASTTVRAAEVDARVGGRYRIEAEGPGGEVHSATGEYLELDAPHRLVKTWIDEGTESDRRQTESVLTVEFREVRPEVTELTLKQTLTPKAEYGEAARAQWENRLEQLTWLFIQRLTMAARA